MLPTNRYAFVVGGKERNGLPHDIREFFITIGSRSNHNLKDLLKSG